MTATVWGQNMWLSAAQVRALDPQVLQRAVLMIVEANEAKARDLGIADPHVTVMFVTEFIQPDPEGEDG